MGRKPKFKTEAERKAHQAEYQRQYRAKHRKGSDASPKAAPKSWVKSLTRKLEAVATEGGPGSASEPPPERKGEPFADLPPLDMPAPEPADASTESADSTTSASDAPSESEGSAPTPTPSGQKSSQKPEAEIFDTKQIEAMATQLAHDGVMMLGAFASERGFFALGEPFAKMAGVAAGVLVRVHAKNVGISDEEAAAWVLGGIVGVNGVQAARAYSDEQKKKQAAERGRFDERRKQAEAARQQTGLTEEEQKQAAAAPVGSIGEQPNTPRFSSGVV